MLQLFSNISKYIEEYFYLVYKLYAKHAVPFFVTYFNIDIENTIWENQSLMGGPYEHIGDLSGVRWKKYLFLPVFFIDETMSQLSAEESGYQDLGGDTSFVIPSEFGFTPYVLDMVKPYCIYPIQPSGRNYPILRVVGIEKSTQTEISFYKLKAETEQSKSEENLDLQVSSIYVFIDYTRKLYEISVARQILELMDKEKKLSFSIMNMFDKNSGFYLL